MCDEAPVPGCGDVGGGEDAVDRIANAHDAAVIALRRAVEAIRAVEAELLAEEERRGDGSRAELRTLRSARMVIVEARKSLTPGVDRAEARRRAFLREHFLTE
jgi:hypothetical protein